MLGTKHKVLRKTCLALALLLMAVSPASFSDGWVAVGESGTILNSQDGITWVNVASSPTGETLRGVAFDGQGAWVAAGQSGTVIRSDDAQNWSMQDSGISEPLWGAVYEGGQWIVTGGTGRIITSPDGAAWTSADGLFSFILYDIAYNGSTLFVIAGDDASGGSRILTSSDAVAWTQETPDPNNGEGLHGISYGESQWVAVGDAGTILTSSDPSSRVWVQQSSQTNVDLRDIVYNGSGLYVVVGREGTILTSTDGTIWQPQSSGTSFDLRGVAYDGAVKYIAVGEEGVVLSSADGRNWDVVYPGESGGPTFRLLYDVASGTLAPGPNTPTAVPVAMWQFYGSLAAAMIALVFYRLRSK